MLLTPQVYFFHDQMTIIEHSGPGQALYGEGSYQRVWPYVLTYGSGVVYSQRFIDRANLTEPVAIQ